MEEHGQVGIMNVSPHLLIHADIIILSASNVSLNSKNSIVHCSLISQTPDAHVYEPHGQSYTTQQVCSWSCIVYTGCEI